MTDAIDASVPGYLGKVIDWDGAAIGTCFQIQPGIIATAAHVLAELDAAREGAQVNIAQLGNSNAASAATVTAVDVQHDLAIMRAQTPLRSSCDLFVASTDVRPATEVVITGPVHVADPNH